MKFLTNSLYNYYFKIRAMDKFNVNQRVGAAPTSGCGIIINALIAYYFYHYLYEVETGVECWASDSSN